MLMLSLLMSSVATAACASLALPVDLAVVLEASAHAVEDPEGPGELTVIYHENGKKAREGRIWKGRRHGLWRAWYDTGELAYEGRIESYKRVGEWKQYHGNGELRSLRGSSSTGDRAVLGRHGTRMESRRRSVPMSGGCALVHGSTTNRMARCTPRASSFRITRRGRGCTMTWTDRCCRRDASSMGGRMACGGVGIRRSS